MADSTQDLNLGDQWDRSKRHPLLAHVLENNCTDPDCEVHNIEVGWEEEVVSQTDVAFWLAGAAWMAEHIKGNKTYSKGDFKAAIAKASL